MTIVAVARVFNKKGEVFISACSDSEISGDETRDVGIVDATKIIKVKDALICVSGSGPILEVLEDLAEDKKFLRGLDLTTKKGVRMIGEQAYGCLKYVYESIPVNIASDDVVGPLLIATPINIWVVQHDLVTYEIEQVYAAGVGADTFLGAFDAFVQKTEDFDHETLDKILKDAVQITNKRVLHCGGKVHIVHAIKKEPPKKKKRK